MENAVQWWQNLAGVLLWASVCFVIVGAVLGGFVYVIGVQFFGWGEDKPAEKTKNQEPCEDVQRGHYRHLETWALAQPNGIIRQELLKALKEEFENG